MTADKNRRPLVLITNDDGIKAGGLRALVEMAEKYADVVGNCVEENLYDRHLKRLFDL